jgi:hypothetical protein
MAQLNDSHVTFILDRIIADGVTDINLQNDLLDHYCCFIEERLSAGADFESVYKIAFQNITPNGMQEIQQELYFILNFNKQTIMKRIIYLFGFLTVFFISTSILFKTFHWDGAAILVLICPFLVIVTATILFSNSLKHWKSHSRVYNTRVVTGFLSALLISDGIIFKLNHFPGGALQVFAGVLLLNLVFLPIFFYGLYKQAIENTSKPLGQL